MIPLPKLCVAPQSPRGTFHARMIMAKQVARAWRLASATGDRRRFPAEPHRRYRGSWIQRKMHTL